MGTVLGPPACWGLQRHLSAILRPACLGPAAGRGASCLFQLLWYFRNAGLSLKLHFKAFNPLVGCIPHAWMWPLQAGAGVERGTVDAPLVPGHIRRSQLGGSVPQSTQLPRDHASGCWEVAGPCASPFLQYVLKDVQLAGPIALLLQITSVVVLNGSFWVGYLPLYLTRT